MTHTLPSVASLNPTFFNLSENWHSERFKKKKTQMFYFSQKARGNCGLLDKKKFGLNRIYWYLIGFIGIKSDFWVILDFYGIFFYYMVKLSGFILSGKVREFKVIWKTHGKVREISQKSSILTFFWKITTFNTNFKKNPF
jgi:hypothetical protein